MLKLKKKEKSIIAIVRYDCVCDRHKSQTYTHTNIYRLNMMAISYKDVNEQIFKVKKIYSIKPCFNRIIHMNTMINKSRYLQNFQIR